MPVTSSRFAKTETRNFSERDRLDLPGTSRSDDLPAWTTSNGVFFTAFVAIAAVLTVAALIAR